MKVDSFFRIYSVVCLRNPMTGDYSYLVQSSGGGLDYFTKNLLPPMVQRFLDEHNKPENCLFLDWQNYIVFSKVIQSTAGRLN